MIARIIVAMSLTLTAALPAGAQRPISSLDWLAGSWQGEVDGGRMDEHWSKPAGDSVLGMSRVVKDGKTTFIEFMLVKREGEDIVLTVSSPGEPEVKFRLSGGAGKEAVFENPTRDFPKKIIYRLRADGVLFARVEGQHGGQSIGQDFLLKPAK